MINEITIKNFKGIKEADVLFNSEKNIFVGNNGVGKSTIIEAMNLTLGFGFKSFELNQYTFHNSTWKEFKESHIPPEILIEIYLSEVPDLVQYSGKNNSKETLYCGLYLQAYFDAKKFPEVDLSQYDTIPYEYYTLERYWFSDTPIHQMQIPLYTQIIDSTSNLFNSRTNSYVTRLIKQTFDETNNADFIGCIRELKEYFDKDEKIKRINDKLSSEAQLAKKDLTISVNFSSQAVWNTIVCPFIKDIPIEQVGQGDLCILKTIISIVDTKKPYKITVLEEPESHLSHTKMYELLNLLTEHNVGQLFVTTHNSFVANRLDIKNIIILTNDRGHISCKRLNEAKDELKFFSKTPNFPTLRIALCQAAILVEGPTDEMLVEYYFRQNFHKTPFELGIEVICVNGVSFKQYYQLIPGNQKVAIITDNDGKEKENLIKYRSITETDTTKLFTDSDISRHTLEISFIEANSDRIQDLANTILKKNKGNATKESLLSFLLQNKSEWSYRLLNDTNYQFNVPEYIVDAINWICPHE